MSLPSSQLDAERQIYLFPRRKLGQKVIPHKGRRPMAIDLAVLQKFFHLPQSKACIALGISLTALKQLCRKLGVTRWPYERKKKNRRSCSKKGVKEGSSCCPSSSFLTGMEKRKKLSVGDNLQQSDSRPNGPVATLERPTLEVSQRLEGIGSLSTVLRLCDPLENISAPAMEAVTSDWEPISQAWIEWYMRCEDSNEM
eukprot:762091-Hanusia_phi.AAC.3